MVCSDDFFSMKSYLIAFDILWVSPEELWGFVLFDLHLHTRPVGLKEDIVQ